MFMKLLKNLILIFCFPIMSLLLACDNNEKDSSEAAEYIISSIPNDDELPTFDEDEFKVPSNISEEEIKNINVKTEYPEYARDTQKINLTLTNNNDYGIGYDEFIYNLEKKLNNIWIEVPFMEGEDGFPYLCGLLSPHDSIETSIDLASHIQLPLEPGSYRIKYASVYTEFMVR